MVNLEKDNGGDGGVDVVGPARGEGDQLAVGDDPGSQASDQRVQFAASPLPLVADHANHGFQSNAILWLLPTIIIAHS